MWRQILPVAGELVKQAIAKGAAPTVGRVVGTATREVVKKSAPITKSQSAKKIASKMADQERQAMRATRTPKPVKPVIDSRYTPSKPPSDMAAKSAKIAGAAMTAGAAAEATSQAMGSRRAAAPASAPARSAAPSRSSPITAPASKRGETFTPNPRSRSTVTGSTQTKGGEYKTYKKDSAMAGDFRSSFAAAKKAGKSEFTWQGRKYSTKTK